MPRGAQWAFAPALHTPGALWYYRRDCRRLCGPFCNTDSAGAHKAPALASEGVPSFAWGHVPCKCVNPFASVPTPYYRSGYRGKEGLRRRTGSALSKRGRIVSVPPDGSPLLGAKRVLWTPQASPCRWVQVCGCPGGSAFIIIRHIFIICAGRTF